MIIKAGVRIKGISQELLLGLFVANEVYALHGVNMVVTSLLDGKHSATSLHYAGEAADLRTRNIPQDVDPQDIRKEIKDRLGMDYDVILEDNHIHMEHQPRYFG